MNKSDDFNDKRAEALIEMAEQWGEDGSSNSVIIITSSPDESKKKERNNAALCLGNYDGLMEGILNAFTAMPAVAELFRDALYFLNAKERNKPRLDVNGREMKRYLS